MATSAGRAAARLLVGDAECPPFVGMTTKVYEAAVGMTIETAFVWGGVHVPCSITG